MKQDTANATAASRDRPLGLRLALAAILLSLAAFSAFGFLCTFEPNPWWVALPWRLGYAGACLGSLAGTVKLFSKRRQPIR